VSSAFPDFGPDVVLNNPAFIHPTALLFGKVTVGPGASIWPYAVIRAENHEVVIGAHSNIQDFAMIHVGDATPTLIGDHCSITHHCTIHGATVGDNCLIGINSTLMDGAVVGANTIVGAGTLITPNTEMPADSVVVGSPAKVIKNRSNYVYNRMNAFLYEGNARAYAAGQHRKWDDRDFMAEASAEVKRLQDEVAAATAAD
jgi:carbonic anhydrase/acetyltransferase-like protein (isoleucine patch superfamily)